MLVVTRIVGVLHGRDPAGHCNRDGLWSETCQAGPMDYERRSLLEVSLQEVVDRTLQQKGIIYGNQANFARLFNTIPAWLSPTGNRRVHHIVRDEEEGLQLRQTSQILGRYIRKNNARVRYPNPAMRPHSTPCLTTARRAKFLLCQPRRYHG